jgi:hypothetical protein
VLAWKNVRKDSRVPIGMNIPLYLQLEALLAISINTQIGKNVPKRSGVMQAAEWGADPAECGPSLHHTPGRCYRHRPIPLHRSVSYCFEFQNLDSKLHLYTKKWKFLFYHPCIIEIIEIEHAFILSSICLLLLSMSVASFCYYLCCSSGAGWGRGAVRQDHREDKIQRGGGQATLLPDCLRHPVPASQGAAPQTFLDKRKKGLFDA